MTSRVYLRDIEELRVLLTGIYKFNFESKNVLVEIAQTIKTNKEYLGKERRYWDSEVRRKEEELRSRKHSKQRDLSREKKALSNAKNSLLTIKRLLTTYDQTLAEYIPNAKYFDQILDSKVSNTKSHLDKYIQELQDYLNSSISGSSYEHVDSLKEFQSSYVNALASFAHQSINPKSQGFVTMAAAIVENEDGSESVVVSSSDRNSYFKRGVIAALPEEFLIKNMKGNLDAEQFILDWAKRNRAKVKVIAASRPICPDCERLILESGAIFASRLKEHVHD